MITNSIYFFILFSTHASQTATRNKIGIDISKIFVILKYTFFKGGVPSVLLG